MRCDGHDAGPSELVTIIIRMDHGLRNDSAASSSELQCGKRTAEFRGIARRYNFFTYGGEALRDVLKC